MSLTTLKEILEDASDKGYGVGSFNIYNLEMARGILQAAEAEKSPIILSLAEVHLELIPFDFANLIMQQVAKEAKTPVCIHFDHGMTKEAIFKAIDAGFTSVMYDGSSQSYEDNIKNSLEILEYASKKGVSLEVELGHVGGGESGTDDDTEMFYTNVEQVADFVARTKCDALAVSIGTVHGKYFKKPKLDIERLSQINKISAKPLVLHGGSGLSDEDLKNTIKNGIRKVNICTDMGVGALRASRDCQSYEEAVPCITKAVRDVVIEKMRLFGSSNKY